MISVRENTFETNSSSCHCLTTLRKEELKEFAYHRHDLCIYLPNSEDYGTTDKYKIMKREDAHSQYVVDHHEQNECYIQNGHEDLCTATYINYDEWEENLEKGLLDDDLGKYLTFEDLMGYMIIEGDVKFDVQWWNND